MKIGIRLFAVCSFVLFFAASFLFESTAQRRGAEFSHRTREHKRIDCATCHKVPTANWIAARGYPDVADYPGHASCVSCHRSDFFRGNHPAVCSTCHVSSGPRAAERLPFPVQSRSREFSTVFPHNVHQDLIASKVNKRDVAVAHFVPASFKMTAVDDKPQFNNCAICHQTTAEMPKFANRTPVVTLSALGDIVGDNFTPRAEFFKNEPSSHASCFSCHYQNVEPTRTDCASCHRLTSPFFETNTTERYSLKFNHQDKDHVNKDCTTCHVRITQNADLRSMRDADVPILTCSTSSCHGGEIKAEIAKREESIAARQPAFQCTYCHAPAVGRFQIPPSHQAR